MTVGFTRILLIKRASAVKNSAIEDLSVIYVFN
jgi:hypothetical protein